MFTQECAKRALFNKLLEYNVQTGLSLLNTTASTYSLCAEC